jgi:hypothetical protein
MQLLHGLPFSLFPVTISCDWLGLVTKPGWCMSGKPSLVLFYVWRDYTAVYQQKEKP